MRLLAPAAFALVLAVSACGGQTRDAPSSGGPSAPAGQPDAPPVDLQDFAAAFVSAICDSIKPCCDKASFPYDAEGCKKAVTPTTQEFLDDLGKPHRQYDAAAAGQCIAQLRAVTSSCVAAKDNLMSDGDPCDHFIVGTLAAGASCVDNNECAAPVGGSAWCEVLTSSPGLPSGTCVSKGPPLRGVAGDTCNGHCSPGVCISEICSPGQADCPDVNTLCYQSDGLFCQEHKCVALSPVGSPCLDGNDGCEVGAVCHQGACLAQQGEGGPCTGEGECLPSYHCSSGTCTARKPVGAACKMPDECLGECDDGICKDGEQIASPPLCNGSGQK